MDEINDKKFELLVEEIKKEKREKCSSIPSNNYGNTDLDISNNKEIKKIKDELKRKRRAVKRSLNNEVDRYIKRVIDDRYGE